MPDQTIKNRKKLRVLVVTLGGNRQKIIEELFADPVMAQDFEPPTFSMGVTSRHIRNRVNFIQTAYEAGLVPREEWKAIMDSVQRNEHVGRPTECFFDCLENIPVVQGRQGSKEDVALHYTVELWRKAKSINRDRSVLACVFAHLIAMKKFVEDGNFDIILEDNVRTDPKSCAQRVRESARAAMEWEEASLDKCHFRFVGWLGSIPNIKWILQTHLPKRKYCRKDNGETSANNRDSTTIGPLPRLEHLEEDMSIIEGMKNTSLTDDPTTTTHEKESPTGELEDESDANTAQQTQQHTKPGGNLLWGAYAYWISKDGYETLLKTLRNDVGAILWKGKRMRNYAVKPIDKILPRQTLSKFRPTAVQITSHPAFFRAPMLTSKIHTKWDPGFCESTAYQLKHTQLDWSNLWLTDTEREIVMHHTKSGKWLTIMELKALNSQES